MTPKVVLVVEDEPALASIYSRALEHHGYRAITIESADEALAIVQQGRPVDLILSDIVMPGMGGRELVWRVREVRPDIRIILASGYANQAGALQMLEDLGVDFIAKPVDLSIMMDTIRRKIGPPSDDPAEEV
jgi:two-component system cell cycle sensor histidine kinase/response regulator CckA